MTMPNQTEAFQKVVEENQTRKILEILRECKTLEEATERIKELIK